MIVYHGSPNKFNQFDYSRIRTNGTSEGVGFYFTDNKGIASGYGDNGYLYTVKLNVSKVLSDNRKTLTIDEIKQLVIELDKQEEYLSNYGDVSFEGYDKVLQIAIDNLYNYNDTDTEILGSIYNECGESDLIIHLFYELLGYDYIESTPDWGSQRLYIALTNDVIEILEIEEL